MTTDQQRNIFAARRIARRRVLRILAELPRKGAETPSRRKEIAKPPAHSVANADGATSILRKNQSGHTLRQLRVVRSAPIAKSSDRISRFPRADIVRPSGKVA
jgi:hypothetical protein